MQSDKTSPRYFRPTWTCGKLNLANRVALMYNLIEGYSYFFEKESALLIGEILNTDKNSEIDLIQLKKVVNTDDTHIRKFLDELASIGLVSNYLPSQKEIESYRFKVGSLNKSTFNYDSSPSSSTKNAETLYSKAIGSSAISSVMLELTYSCNEMCLHCYNPGATRNKTEKNGRGTRKEMTIEEYKKLIDDLDELGVYKITLTGGEPFVKSEVWELLDYISSKNIAIDIFTNGQKIESYIEKLLSYYPRLIGLSLYSGTPEIHDKITRVKGSFNKTINVIQQLSEYGTPTTLKCVVMQPNVSSYFQVKEIAKEYGAQVEFDLNVTDSVEGDKCASKSLRLTEEMMEIVLTDPEISNQLSFSEIKNGVKTRALEDKICGAGLDSFCVTPEGHLQPCVAFPYSFGNITEQEGINAIITNNEDLAWWRMQGAENLLGCYTHDYCSYCRVCPGNNFVENGNPLIPSENNCAIAKMKFNFAQKLKNGYSPLNGKTLETRLLEVQPPEKQYKRINSKNFRGLKHRLKE
jgi:radical SAM protein with 4Fe4S-binding SPASM domain